jgi:hypothetical protein
VAAPENESEMIRAINRNTRATRAIAIVLVGWLPGLIVGGVIAAIGSVILNYNTNAGVSFIASGVFVFVLFAFISIVSAWLELRLSAFDGTSSDRPRYDYYEVDTVQSENFVPRRTNASQDEKKRMTAPEFASSANESTQQMCFTAVFATCGSTQDSTSRPNLTVVEFI